MKAFKISFLLTIFLVFVSEAAHVRKSSSGFSWASNSFGLDLLKQLGANNDVQSPRENIFFSPYSISMALSMLHQGALGSTAEQLEKVLKFDQTSNLNSEDRSVVAKEVHTVNNQISQDGEQQPNKFVYGNLMVVDQQMKVKDDFVKNVREYFEGEVMPADFKQDAQGVMTRINEYMANKTHGMIKHMLDKAPSQDTVMALINSVYFKGEWAKKFDEKDTETGVFYGHDGQQYNGVKYMKAHGTFPHVELSGLDADMVMLKYKGEDMVFVGVLPRNRGTDLAQIRKALNATYINEMMLHTISYQQSTVFMPRMEVMTTYDLIEPLKTLGVQDVFTENSNLAGITEKQQLKVSSVAHKAKLVLNEQGTEAGAGTYVEIAVMSFIADPPTFRFDHPFLYFVHHLGTGQMLFLGEVHQL